MHIIKPKPCLTCGETFQPVGNRAMYCDKCRERTCPTCGKHFQARVEDGLKGAYCSVDCYLKERWKGRREVRACKECGAEFEVIKSLQKSFCTASCRIRAIWKRPEHRAKQRHAIKADRVRNYDKRIEQLNAARLKRGKMSDATKEKLRQARLRQKFPTKMTGIEKKLHDGFKDIGLEFEMHKTLFGRFQPDFVFESAGLVVQADGDYWHSRPGMIERDGVFNRTAAEHGWRVLRLRERDINTDLTACIQRVVEHL